MLLIFMINFYLIINLDIALDVPKVSSPYKIWLFNVVFFKLKHKCKEYCKAELIKVQIELTSRGNLRIKSLE